MRVWVGKRQAASGCWVGKRRACSKLTPMSACALHPCSILHHCSAQLANVVSVAWRAGGSPGAPEARLAPEARPGQLCAPRHKDIERPRL